MAGRAVMSDLLTRGDLYQPSHHLSMRLTRRAPADRPIVDTRTAALLPCRPGSVEHIVSEVVRVRALVVGEVLWDVFPDSTRLGGAALNFAVHLKRFGHMPRVVSAVGQDTLGESAAREIKSLGLDTTWLQSSDHFRTGTATVRLGPGDRTSFVIERPAAYDAVQISDAVVAQIVDWKPSWCYYGTLFPSRANGRHVLRRLLDALP